MSYGVQVNKFIIIEMKYIIMCLIVFVCISKLDAIAVVDAEIVLQKAAIFNRSTGEHPNPDLVLPQVTHLLDQKGITFADKLTIKMFGDVTVTEKGASPAEVVIQVAFNISEGVSQKITGSSKSSNEIGARAVFAVEIIFKNLRKSNDSWRAEFLSIEILTQNPDAISYVNDKLMDGNLWRKRESDFIIFYGDDLINGYVRSNSRHAAVRMGYEISIEK